MTPPGALISRGTESVSGATLVTLDFDSVAIWMGKQFGAGSASTFDNIEITTGNIPEPASFVLLGIGVVSIAAGSYRRD